MRSPEQRGPRARRPRGRGFRVLVRGTWSVMGRLSSGGLTTVLALLALAGSAPASPAAAQQLVATAATEAAPAAPAAQEPALTAITTTPCGNQAAAPAALPPAGSPPFIWILEPCFPRQGNTSSIESETYM